MRSGRHFPIPEGPADLARLWATAAPLDEATRPAWLEAEDDEGDFRCAGSVSLAGLTAAERAAALAEFNELEFARLVVEEDPGDADRHHVYVREPRPQPVWSIGMRTGATPWSLGPPGADTPAVCPADVTDAPVTSVADPFLIRVAGRWHLFFEADNWLSRKGEIGLATSDDGLAWRYERIVLAEPFHLSYPCVFEADGGIWMVPESSQAGSVRLYRARRFPHEWEHVSDLLTGKPFADSTLLKHAGLWWLFTETSGDRNDELRLYHADALAGPWREHPASPLVAGDDRIARPAGPVLAAEGRLVRLAQNCRPAYGTDVRSFEITTLTATAYAERPLAAPPLVGPGTAGWNAGGMHHVAAVPRGDGSWLAAVDGWRLEGAP